MKFEFEINDAVIQRVVEERLSYIVRDHVHAQLCTAKVASKVKEVAAKSINNFLESGAGLPLKEIQTSIQEGVRNEVEKRVKGIIRNLSA